MAKEMFKIVLLAIAIVVAVFALSGVETFITGFAGLGNYNETTASATVNNAAPSVGTVNVQDVPNEGGLGKITLYGGATKLIVCNATITDTNGWNDISSVKAWFWKSGSDPSGTNNYTYEYSNSSCALGSNISETSLVATCQMQLQYNTDPATTWKCRMQAFDGQGSSSNGTSSAITVEELTAINVDETLNFGALELGATSPADVNHTIFNYGNVELDMKLNGSAVLDCPSGSDDIPIGNLRYHCSLYGQTYANMIALTTTSTLCTDFNLAKSMIGTGTVTPTEKELPWKIRIPDTGVRGTCTGTVFFIGQKST